MFEVFPIPAEIEHDLLDFFARQTIFPLSDIKSRAPANDKYRVELGNLFGVYVLYYRGPFELYRDLADVNREEFRKPIYVGKAVSKGGRIGGKKDGPQALPSSASDVEDDSDDLSLSQVGAVLSERPRSRQDNSLFKRLNEHAKSIRAASSTLSVEDFYVRVIPMSGALVQWAEATMIGRLSPIWNSKLSGFGNHDPGKGRYEQARSIWDQTHPGRPWAEKLHNLAPHDREQIRRLILRTLDVNLKKS